MMKRFLCWLLGHRFIPLPVNKGETWINCLRCGLVKRLDNLWRDDHEELE